MPLMVKYPDNTIDKVPKCLIRELLFTGSIVAFKRSDDEWVDPKIGPLRGEGKEKGYNGPERRKKW